MIGNSKLLAVIPGRGGSKRLPHKNVLPFAGKPLISWTIEAALNSRVIDSIVVSTDCEDIKNVAASYKNIEIISRPHALATDEAKSIDVVLHAMSEMDGRGYNCDTIILLQPTSPLRRASDIDNAALTYVEKNADSVVSLTRAEHHPWWCGEVDQNGGLLHFMRSETREIRSQELPIMYRLNGAIYIADKKILYRKHSFWGANPYSYIMPPERSVDIDSKMDFQFAEFLASQNIGKGDER